MTFKRALIWGLSAAAGSAAACIVWDRIYHFAMMTDFTKVINPVSIVATNLIIGVVIATGYWVITKWENKNAGLIFNLSLSLLSIISIMMPLSISLPLDIEFPELFLGLAAPMHLFPALSWFTLQPIFKK
ncbi:MAG: hypothetical protein H7Y00_03015 [Fimbriimonadaceae bacterium]|nr:hypothetical protein [Chitinophagales bacterium]